MSDPTLTDQLFRRFLGVYGNRFTRMWDGLDVADVKRQWEAMLSKFEPKAIGYALDHLPESNPPTLLEFRSLCNRAPDTAVLLPGPKADPNRVSEAVAGALVAASAKSDGPRAWAYRLRDREKQGSGLSKFQRQAWREALKGLE